MGKLIRFFALIAFLLFSCSKQKKPERLTQVLNDVPHIKGKKSYLSSPYLTAGDRVYMVGGQDGSFPELGWHIKGEMGGIWNHPIKLMDGFDAELIWENMSLKLDSADTFINYPFANEHQYEPKDKALTINRFQFVPDGLEGLVVQYSLQNKASTTQNFNFKFTGHSDLLPTWLGERTQMEDGTDKAEFLNDKEAWLAKDTKNDWYVIYGSDQPLIAQSEVENTYQGSGVSNALTYSISLRPDEKKDIAFYIVGSYTSKDELLSTFDNLKNNAKTYLSAKKERYASLAGRSKLTIPDKKMEQAFEWLKYNCDWLIRTVPEVGTGITAGIPDYPWWFGVDSEYALKGYMAIGQTDAVYSTIKLLDSVSGAVNGNGKIIHEMSTNGAVFNDGNINETPQFASLIWEIYQWNGDDVFLKKYFPTIKKGLDWLMRKNDANGNLFPDGFGMMEIHGLDSEMIDVAAYTQRAFSDAAKIARVLNENLLAEEYKEISYSLWNKINQEFWSEEFGSFADFLGTDEQALHLIDDAIVRADTLNKPWAIDELKATKENILKNPSKGLRPFVLHHNWVVNTPMEMQIADSTKAIRALETAEKFVNPFGVFVTGIDRDASAGSNDGSFKGSKVFSYTGAVMTLPTGVQAIAENNYGRPDKALNYLQRMTRTFSYALPGSIYEVSPDYGMMAQAWNIYSYAIPIVQQFFGIRPEASKKKVVIRPQMPSEWNKASLENVVVANNSVSVFYEKTSTLIKLKVTQTDPNWIVEIVLPKTEGVDYDGTPNYSQEKSSKKEAIFTSRSEVIELQLPLK
jgi:glycogen debranching enzyme